MTSRRRWPSCRRPALRSARRWTPAIWDRWKPGSRRQPRLWEASTSTFTNTSGKGQKQLDDWTTNFDVDLRALVGGVAAAADAPRRRRRLAGEHRHPTATTQSTSLRARAATARSRPPSSTGRWARPRCSAQEASAATWCRPGRSSIDGGDWDADQGAALPGLLRGHPEEPIPAARWGPAQGCRQRGGLPGRRRGPPHQRGQRHRRRRLPQACRLLRRLRRLTAERVDACLVAGGKYHDIDFAPPRAAAACWPSIPMCAPGSTPTMRTTAALDGCRFLGELHLRCAALRAGPSGILRSWVERGGRWVALHGTNSAVDLPRPRRRRVAALLPPSSPRPSAASSSPTRP